MKTFEEACAIFTQPAKPGQDEKDMQAVCGEILKKQSRYSQIGQEIADSAVIEPLLHAFNQAHYHGGLSIEACLVNAFILGVKVGMEMERQELPKS